MQIRLEVPFRSPADGTRYVDLTCRTSGQRALVEFKYVTRAYTWTAPDGEEFRLKNHAAMDLARLHFVHDVHRLESLIGDDSDTTGIALLLTNADALWGSPGRRVTRDVAFRLHEGRSPLSGTLTWGPDDNRYPANERVLNGNYPIKWHDYTSADLSASAGYFRWLAFQV